MTTKRKWIGIYSHEEDAITQARMTALAPGWTDFETLKTEDGYFELYGTYDPDRKEQDESEHSRPDGQPN